MVQAVLVVVAVLAVPWMLLIKPLYLRHVNKQKAKTNYDFKRFSNTGNINDAENQPVPDDATVESDEEPFNFSEVMCYMQQKDCISMYC